MRGRIRFQVVDEGYWLVEFPAVFHISDLRGSNYLRQVQKVRSINLSHLYTET